MVFYSTKYEVDENIGMVGLKGSGKFVSDPLNNSLI